MSDSWPVRRLAGAAATLHERGVPDPPARAVWVLDASGPALVLGSTQQASTVRGAEAAVQGVEVVRRRSGGGAVLVRPGDPLWVDVIVPAGDPLWDHDVARAAHWLGETWASALAEVGTGPAVVHRGPLACGPLGRLVCFGTVGAGEVTVDGRKVVGISQRRTRAAARFQCALYRRWDPGPLARLLGLDDEATTWLGAYAAGSGAPHAATLTAFLRHLPA